MNTQPHHSARGGAVSSSGPRNLVELLRGRAAGQGGRLSHTFLEADETRAPRTLTYGELDAQSRAVAATLQGSMPEGARALLLYPPGLEFIPALFGCLYANVVAVPAYPPDPARLQRTLQRLLAIIADAEASVVLTTAQIVAQVKSVLVHSPALASLRWVATDDLGAGAADGWREPEVDEHGLAFMQYTSGSTGSPKGVMLSHRNLLHNAGLVRHAFEQTERETYVSWLPTFHDMGLMAGVLEPIYGGYHSVVMSPLTFLQHPARWLQAITRYAGTVSGGPNFAYDLCARKVSDEQKKSLDLGTWSVAFSGSEPVRHETIERFSRAFAPCGFRRTAFYPCYGLAEATLIVSGGRRAEAPRVAAFDAQQLESGVVAPCGEGGRRLVGCGKTLPDQRIAIVNPETLTECAADEIGEVWVSGPSVAAGYWNNQAETERTFKATIAGFPDATFLRTGDLGFTAGGELFIASRLKDLIIIRGLNHFPQDIELTAESSHPALRPGGVAAFSVDVDGQEQLVVVQEVNERPGLDYAEVAGAIRQAVARGHELQAHAVVLIKSSGVPKTSSGKIQRSACRRMFLEGRLEEVARDVLREDEAAPAEESFIRKAILAAGEAARPEVLKSYVREQVSQAARLAPARVGHEAPLAALGLDSLAGAELRHKIETDLGVSLPPGTLLHDRSVSDLARQLEGLLHEPPRAAAPPPVAEESGPEEYPLSHVQRALWFFYQLAPDSSAYNVHFAARVRSEIDGEALRASLALLVSRHPALRTVFASGDGGPTQKVSRETAAPDFAEVDASAWGEEELRARVADHAYEPFVLETGPVFRARLFTSAPDSHVLLLCAHHIVMDGWSFWQLLDELNVIYPSLVRGRDPQLPPAAGYDRFVRWQSEMLAGPEGERLMEFWRRELAGELPVLDLPADRPRPPVQTYRGAAHAFALGAGLTRRLERLAATEATTLYTVLLAAFGALLHRHTGEEDILIGSPTSARTEGAFADVVGCFFNAVVVRADLSGEPSFLQLLRRTREKLGAALRHQAYPSHLLAEQFQPPARDLSRPPLFQTAFIWQKPHRFPQAAALLAAEPPRRVELGGLKVEHFPVEKRFARSDLELEMIESGGQVFAWLNYSADLFNPSTVARMASHFERLLAGIADDPARPVSELPMLSEAESQLLLREWSNQGAAGHEPSTVHAMFVAQAERAPDKTAAHSPGGSLTFRELDEQSDRLANLIEQVRYDSK